MHAAALSALSSLALAATEEENEVNESKVHADADYV
jgi:hypothetical protein